MGAGRIRMLLALVLALVLVTVAYRLREPSDESGLSFSLAGLGNPAQVLDAAQLKRPAVLNIWASWCVPCRQEIPQLMSLSKRGGVAVYGLNYRDSAEDASRWLEYYGNPYTRVGIDPDGSELSALAREGIPQTLVVGLKGEVVFRHVGPITDRILEDQLMPLVAGSGVAGGKSLGSANVSF